MEAELGRTSLEQVVADAEGQMKGIRGERCPLFSLDNYDKIESLKEEEMYPL